MFPMNCTQLKFLVFRGIREGTEETRLRQSDGVDNWERILGN